jgi:transcriptional regulator with XRE-family HTH domain
MSMHPGRMVQEARKRHRLSQKSLAIRAATDQAAISRIERGEISPTLETVERLMAAMGEQLVLDSKPVERQHDPLHIQASLNRSPEERLKLAISWNRLAGRLAEAGRQARGA